MEHDNPEILEEFVTDHTIDETALDSETAKAIHWTRRAKSLLNQGFSTLSETYLGSSPGVGLQWHLLQRGFDRVEAALAALGAGSSASAEILSRTTLELAVSIRYILEAEQEARLIAFFRDYVEKEKDRLDKWSRELGDLDSQAKEIHRSAIQHRQSGVAALQAVVSQLRTEFEDHGSTIDGTRWPNIYERFEAIDEEITYRTVYGRMSSQVHADAEDPLRFFLSRAIDDEKLKTKMKKENRDFSIFMTCIAVHFQLIATSDFMEEHGMESEAAGLRPGIESISDLVKTLSSKVR